MVTNAQSKSTKKAVRYLVLHHRTIRDTKRRIIGGIAEMS